MRILFDGLPLRGQVTGVGHYGRQLLAALSRHCAVERVGVFDGWRVDSAASFLASLETARPENTWRRQLARVRWNLPLGRQVAQPWRSWRLARQARHAEWSLFHEPNYVAPRFAGPVVTTVHDMAFLRYPQFLPRDRRRFLTAAIRPALERSAAILADSQFTRDELLELCPWVESQRVVVAHLGVDREAFRPEADCQADRERLRPWGLPEQFLLYLGTLEPRKNLQGLLAAYAQLPDRLQRAFPLLLAGMRGWNESYFRGPLRALEQAGRIRRLGYVPQAVVPALLRSATLFCFPSLYEGFGLPPLEAMAAGTPVLAASAASLPEVLGQAALWVDPHSPQDIARGLHDLLEDEHLRAAYARRGLAHVGQFTWDRTAEATVSAYRRVLWERASGRPMARQAA